MSGWSVLSGTAACLLIDDIDTDQLIPARFMSRPRTDGYGDLLLHDLRHDQHHKPDPDFVLARHPNVVALVTGRNFGSGSSREAAVYALVDFGIRAVIAPGFGDIFAANAVNNGLLPARVSKATLDTLSQLAEDDALAMRIELEHRRLVSGTVSMTFDLDPTSRDKLINGWDDVDLTLAHHDDIHRFRERRKQQSRWTWPSTPADSHPPNRRQRTTP